MGAGGGVDREPLGQERQRPQAIITLSALRRSGRVCRAARTADAVVHRDGAEFGVGLPPVRRLVEPAQRGSSSAVTPKVSKAQSASAQAKRIWPVRRLRPGLSLP
jgi:hypothetical protein